LLEILILNTTKYVGMPLKSAWAMSCPFHLLLPGTAKHVFFNCASFSFQC